MEFMKKLAAIFLLFTAFLLSAGESYSFHLLSDLHLGAADTYHPTRFKGDIHRAERVMPVFSQMFSDMMKVTPDAKFVIQLGDLIEGNAKGQKEHEKQINEAVAFLKKSFPCPVYHTMGNHEPYGIGNAEAIKTAFMPEIAGTIGKKQLKFANYTLSFKDDLFIFADFRNAAKSHEYILNTLKNLKKKPRYIFIAVHMPLVTRLTDTKLVDELSKYNVIVMSGHIHRNLLIHYVKNGNSLTQITVCTKASVSDVKNQQMKLSSQDKKTFRDFILYQATKRKMLSFMPDYDKDWAPYISSFASCYGNGFATLHVSDSGVYLKYHGPGIAAPAVTLPVIKK